MFPHESPYSGVRCDRLVGPILSPIVVLRALDWDVVEVGQGQVRNLGLQDVRNVLVENGHRVGPPHGQRDEPMRSERCLEGGQIARRLGDLSLVVSDVEIQCGATGPAGELLCEMLGDRRDS